MFVGLFWVVKGRVCFRTVVIVQKPDIVASIPLTMRLAHKTKTSGCFSNSWFTYPNSQLRSFLHSFALITISYMSVDFGIKGTQTSYFSEQRTPSNWRKLFSCFDLQSTFQKDIKRTYHRYSMQTSQMQKKFHEWQNNHLHT